MLETKTQTFRSTAETVTLAREEIGEQILSTIFGLSFTGRDSNNYLICTLSEFCYIQLSTSSAIILYFYVNNSSIGNVSIDCTFKNNIYVTTCSWIESEYLKKLGGIWIWKGKYCKNHYGYLTDIATGTTYSASLKDIGKPGMVAITPLYTADGEIIQDAFMYSCSAIVVDGLYYIGGRLCYAISSSTFLAVE